MTLSFLSPAPWSYLGDFVLLCPTFVSSSAIFLKFSPFRTNGQHLICYWGCWGFISHSLSLIPSSPLGSCWIVAVVSGTDSPINSVSLHWSPFFLLRQEKTFIFISEDVLFVFSLVSLSCCPLAVGSVNTDGSSPSAQAPESIPPCFKHNFASSALSSSAGARACSKIRKKQ